jgi:hypothetical protein
MPEVRSAIIFGDQLVNQDAVRASNEGPANLKLAEITRSVYIAPPATGVLEHLL